MKIKQYGAKMEELKRAGKTNREIAVAVGLKQEQVKGYFKRSRKEQRLRGYPRSRKDDAQKTNQALRSELKSLRMEVVNEGRFAANAALLPLCVWMYGAFI